MQPWLVELLKVVDQKKYVLAGLKDCVAQLKGQLQEQHGRAVQ